MQNMHPQPARPSRTIPLVFTERLPRLFWSLYPIMASSSMGTGPRRPAPRCATTTSASGSVDEKGRRYNAWTPRSSNWAHATFFMGTILTAEHFGDG